MLKRQRLFLKISWSLAMDIKRPFLHRKPAESVTFPVTALPQQPINGQDSGLQPTHGSFKKPRRLKKFFIIISIAVILISLLITGLVWGHHELSAVSTDKTKLIEVTIASGSTPAAIGDILQKDGIIRSSFAFSLYIRLTGTQDKLEAGTYRLAPSESTQEIIQHLVKGTVDQFSITFLPGATLAQDRQVLIDAGFSTTDVDTALSAPYSSALFAGRPSTATLEGYIYGQTYDFNSGASVGDILQRTFSEFETVVQQNNLVSAFAAHGLNLYQGITLASIIQREVQSASDQKQVAQIFYLRLATNLPLGSDVTYIYAATLLGVTPTPTLDSPYNTRLYAGLPPGPIATPGLTALQAVASPASGDYLYFLSGDDGKTYFATTEAEHEANIANYCKVKCSD
jgi:UPF0755 protein